MKHIRSILSAVMIMGLIALISCSKSSNSTSGNFSLDGTSYKVTDISAGAYQVYGNTSDGATSLHLAFPGTIGSQNTANYLPHSGTYYVVYSTSYTSLPADSVMTVTAYINGSGGVTSYRSTDSAWNGTQNVANGRVTVTLANGIVNVSGSGIGVQDGVTSPPKLNFSFGGGYHWP